MSAHCEAKLHGFRRTQDGVVVSFVLHPQEVPQCLALDPLGTRYMLAVAQIGDDEQPIAEGHEAASGDAAAPTSPVVPEGGENRDAHVTNVCDYCGETGHSAGKCPKARYAAMDDMAKARVRAALLPQDARFRVWASPPPEGGRNRPAGIEVATDFIRHECGIKSRSEIATNYDAYLRFLALENRYRIAVGLAPEPRE